MADLRQISQEDKRNLIIDEMFEYKGKEFIERLHNRFHQKDIWNLPYHKTPFMYQGNFKNVQPYSLSWANRYIHNFENRNI
mmetsp:Transcript_32349/g.29169  ORF Transcript_32349/g.29169 Transcript_32349/m.29169 type:complete len:81 (-) Transcript_32349:129-371(-)